MRRKYEEIKQKAIGNRRNLTNTQINVLKDLIHENKRTDLTGLRFYENLKPFINDAYVQIVKNKKMCM